MDSSSKAGYKRLPGRGPRKKVFFSGVFSRCSLYLGDDHILSVDNNGFSENYKRFYFSDIQALVTQETHRGRNWSLALASLSACSLMGSVFLANANSHNVFLILCGIFILFLSVNLFRGPTCTCHILTAVQEDSLPSLNRLKVARKVTATLRITIEQVQGTLSQDLGPAGQEETTPIFASTPRTASWTRGKIRQIRHENGTVHLIAFILILADGFLTAIVLLNHSVPLTAISSLLGALNSIFIIVSLVKQHGSDIPTSVRRMTWLSLFFICISYFLGYILMITSLMAHPPQKTMTQWDMYRALLDLSPQDSSFLWAIYLFSATWSFIVGALGIMRIKKHRDASRRISISGQNPEVGFRA